MALAVAGVAVAAGLSGLYGWWWLHDHAFAIGPRMVIILLILLNARQNLRQYRYAGVIADMMEMNADAPAAAPSPQAPVPGGDPGSPQRPIA